MKKGEECIQKYEGREVNCIVDKINENQTFDVFILGLGIKMVQIPKIKYNPKYCMPDDVESKEDYINYIKDIGYENP